MSRYNKSNPGYDLDVKVASWFGRDVKGEYTEEANDVIQYLTLPHGCQSQPQPNYKFQVDWNLNIKHKEDERRYDGITYEHVFEWISRHCKDGNGKPKLRDVDFICKRKSLQNLMLDEFSGKILATRVRGVIYICEYYYESEDQKWMLEKNTIKDSERVGSKFEHHLLADTPGGKVDTNRPIRCYDDVALVYRARVGRHRVLYAGEVDGLPDAEAIHDLNNTNLVELKTIFGNVNSEQTNRRWWVQAKLSKCDWILLGRRLSDWTVSTLEWVSTSLMEQSAKNWNHKNVIASGHDYLNMIKENLKSCEDGEVCLLERRNHKLVLLPTPKDALNRVLPEFYQQWLEFEAPKEKGLYVPPHRRGGKENNTFNTPNKPKSRPYWKRSNFNTP